MKKLILLLTCLYGLPAAAASFDPANTYVLVTGVLEWKNKALAPFSPVHRKDAELKKCLGSMGVPAANIVMLNDRQATLAAMKKQVKSISARCNSRSTFIFYYAGHGLKTGNRYYFANYDADPSACEKTAFDLGWLGEQLPKINKSAVFMLWADCCYSGGLINEAKKMAQAGRQVLVFSSATASNTSTGNWTFTQTLIDCFSDKTLHDTDHDGQITDADVSRELRDAMKFREHQLYGYYSNMEQYTFLTGTGNTGIQKPKAGDLKEYVNGEYAYGLKDDRWYPVRIVNGQEHAYTVQFYFYSDYTETTLGRLQLKKMYFPRYDVDRHVLVEWNGQSYKATILKAENDFYFIKYDGYEDSWNEWVMYDRISTGEEKKVQVLEKGQWYPGRIIEERDGKYFVHYDGFDHTWDEWVTSKRIKTE